MNRYTSFLLGCGFTLSPLLPAFAAPSFSTSPNASPTTDSAALALLKKSAAAYTNLGSFSATLNLKGTITAGGKEELTKSTGVFAFKRPGKSSLSLNGKSSFYRSVQDGKNIYTQQEAKTYQVADSPKEMGVTGAISSQRSYSLLMAAFLINGASPFTAKDVSRMKLAIVKGFPQVSIKLPPSPGMSDGNITLEFNPRTKLLRSSEVKIKSRNSLYHDYVAFSEVKLNPKLAPALFTFVPNAGAKRVDGPQLFDPTLKVGGKPHEISGIDFKGRPIALANYRGKVVLIDFWATWCGPCIAEIPNMLAAYKKYNLKGFDIVSISSDEDKNTIQKFVAARKLPWTQTWEKDFATSPGSLYKVGGIPFLLLVGKDGKIAAINPRGEALAPAVEAALAK